MRHEQCVRELWKCWTGDEPDTIECQRVAADRGVTSRVELLRYGGLKAVLKTPIEGFDRDWAVREAWFLQTVGSEIELQVPTLLASKEVEHGRALLLSWCPGVDGDVGLEPDEALARRVLEAVVPLHGMVVPDGALGLLPRWGSGSAGTSTPHLRRHRRFMRRHGACLQAWADPVDRPWLDALSVRLGDSLQADAQALAALSPRLLHGDLHADNLRLDGDEVALLDWQSTSLGSPVHDVAVWLSAHVDHGRLQPMSALARNHLEFVDAWPGQAMWLAALRATLSGLMSAYGNRGPSAAGDREAREVRRLLSSRGLAGALVDNW